MLIRSLEYLLIDMLNGAWTRRREREGTQGPTDVSVPSDFTVLGHLIPDEPATPDEQVMRRLGDAGIVALSPEARMRHLYLLGATGTGKTNLLLRLIESDIESRRAFCVFDLRGDLVDRILLRLAAAGSPEAWSKRLLLIDLRGNDHATGFNPLAGDADSDTVGAGADGGGSDERQADTYARALLLLSIIKKQSDSWGVQLEDTLRHSFMALSETGWSLLEVRPLLSNAAFRAQVMAGVRDSQVKAFFAEWNQLSAAERNNRSSAALNKLSPILSVPALRRTFGQRHGFSFSALLDKEPGMVILVSLGVDRLHDAARLAGGLLVSSLQTAVMARVDQPESQRVPVHLYVDEFECLASDKFEEIVAEGRRFRVGLTLSHQNLSQLPRGLRDVIRNNVHTQVFFQTGAVDAGDLAREIGIRKSPAKGQPGTGVRAALMSQGVGEAFLVRRGQTAARMRTLRSDDPGVDAQRVMALREAAYTAYARPRAAVERELQEREEGFRALQEMQAGQPVAAGAAVFHIRHSKTARFAPDDPASDATLPPTPANGESATGAKASSSRRKNGASPQTGEPANDAAGKPVRRARGPLLKPADSSARKKTPAPKVKQAGESKLESSKAKALSSEQPNANKANKNKPKPKNRKAE